MRLVNSEIINRPIQYNLSSVAAVLIHYVVEISFIYRNKIYI